MITLTTLLAFACAIALLITIIVIVLLPVAIIGGVVAAWIFLPTTQALIATGLGILALAVYSCLIEVTDSKEEEDK